MTASGRGGRRGRDFPIAEAYGFPYSSVSPLAHATWEERRCPFAERPCEKWIQYKYGYCSVTYAAQWDNGQPRPYAVCDHRLDGAPIKWVVSDHFGDLKATIVPEVTVTTSPKLNVDYVAYRDDVTARDGVDLVAIESQAIDLRGGGVGPAWRAWEDGNPEQWREYFSAEAKAKGRKDTVEYGVNTGNVYKRLGTQIAAKGEYLKQVGVPLYVVAQQSILNQLRRRVDFRVFEEGAECDITFVGFDYVGGTDSNGQLKFEHIESVRTSLEEYIRALTASPSISGFLRADFILKVKRKAVLETIGRSQVPLSGLGKHESGLL